jgi:phospholipid/cholesterol/gamma-HCH transport system substrate-binding protein
MVANAQQASAALGHASGQADSLLSDIESRQLPAKVDETLAEAKSATSNINETSKQIRQSMAEAIGPDREGISAGANISETLSNMNVATANMADDTEALKHSFFFRGFFRRRGYYNLNDMQAEKYRKDRVFVSPDNYRAWLSSTELFIRDSNGKEQLSAQGRQSLNAIIIQKGESIVNRAVVIEGYSNTADEADQLSSSRIRAILVRQYLQSHFQLSAGDLGVVSMKNAPPEGLGHSPWDGVCVVVLNGRP